MAMLEFVYISQNLGNRLEQLLRDAASHIHSCVQRPCQGLVFHDRHAVFPRQLLDFLSHSILSLGQHHRSRHAGLILQCHGKVGRVGDDDIRLGHFLHHSGHGHLTLLLTDLSLDLGITFLLLEFFLDLLLAHLQILGILPFLINQVKDGHHHEQPDNLKDQVKDHLGNLGHAGKQIHKDQLGHLPQLLRQVHVHQRADNGNLD